MSSGTGRKKPSPGPLCEPAGLYLTASPPFWDHLTASHLPYPDALSPCTSFSPQHFFSPISATPHPQKTRLRRHSGRFRSHCVSPGSLAQPEKPGQGSSWSRYRNGATAQCWATPFSRTAILYAPYSRFCISLGFLPETWQLWKLIHILFCLRLSLPSTHLGLVCLVLCLHGWVLPWKDVLWS